MKIRSGHLENRRADRSNGEGRWGLFQNVHCDTRVPASISVWCIGLSLQDKLRARHALQLVQAPHLYIHDPQHRVFVLALDGPDAPVPPLLLLFDLHRLALHAHHAGPALKQSLVQVVWFACPLRVVALGVVKPGLEREVSGAEDRGAVQPEDVPWCHAVHVEGQTHNVALGHEVGEAMYVCGDVVWVLCL